MTVARAVLREATAMAISQRVASLLTVTMLAGMCVAVLLTSGRTAAAEAAALAQIDAAGTRSIMVRADEDAGLDAAAVERVAALEEVDAVVGLGPITDVRNSMVPGGPLVPLRTLIGQLRTGVVPGQAYASPAGAQALGLRDGTGSVTTADGRDFVVAGLLDVPELLRGLEPLVVVPTETTVSGPVTLMVILVEEPRTVAVVTSVLVGLLGVPDATRVTIETSGELAEIRAAVSGELATYGRSTVLVIVGATALLVAAHLFGLVQLRRKDFGRRRALGASQRLVIALVLTQVGLLGASGAVVGTVATLVGLRMSDTPVPTPQFSLAVATIAVLAALLAAMAPALVASRREPLYELRVP